MPSGSTVSVSTLHEYWLDPWDSWEQPDNYVGPFARSEVLRERLEPHLDPADRVLEVGCAAGANLAHLYEHGYRDLVAIELNPEMLSLFEQYYSTTYRATDIRQGPLEQEVRSLASDSVDATVAVAVLAHLHPSSEFVFDELVRVTERSLITIENERTEDDVFFPRNYREVFESRGCEQVGFVDSETLHERTELSDNCVARVFAVDP